MKKFILILMCLLFAAICFAQAPILVKVASVAPSRSPWEVEQKNLSLEWSKITNGKVKLQFYDCNALGGESGTVQKLRAVRPGQKSPIDGAVLTNIGVYEMAPETNVLTLSVPFLFNNQEELTYILDKYHDEIEAGVGKQGFYLLGWFNVGWANFLTKKEVRLPEEIKAIKLSVGGITSPELGRAFQKAGYTVEDLPNEKISASIKSANGVKGLYTIPMYAFATQYYKSLPYVIEMPLCPVMAGFVIQKSTWDKIPAEYRDELAQSIKRAEAKFIGVQQKNDGDYLKKMEDDGANLVRLTSEEIKAWQDSLTTDAKYMSTQTDVKVINYDFFTRIEKDLKEFRAKK